MPSGAERLHKVVLFGETGSGKSSIVNLLSDGPVANVAIGAEACTRRSEWYQISLGGKIFRLWDTMGFSAEADPLADPRPPYEQAHSVLRNLGDGVDLVLLCVRHDGINASLRSLYWLLDSFFFRGRATIALVITKLDDLDNGWWYRNKDNIAHVCNIPVQFLPHACVTTISTGFDSNRVQSKHALEVLLENHVTTRTPLDDLHLPTDAYEMAVRSLETRCLLSRPEATRLVGSFRSPKRPFHAVLLGEHGVGKSSIINSIVGSSVAEVSDGFYTCTLNCSSYEVNTGSQRFRVWDTMSLNGPFEHQQSQSAIESIARLVCDLRRQGDLDVLVFCKEFNWTPPWELQIFRLFREFLCESKLPVAFIVTYPENFDPAVEKWWEKNGNALLAALKMEKEAVAGHACISSAPDEKIMQDKLSLSRQMVHAMLEDSVSYSTGTFYREWMQGRDIPTSERMTTKNLMSHCGLTEELAGKLCELFHASEPFESKDTRPQGILEEKLQSEEDKNVWWIDERFGPDSSNCISLPIFS